LIGTDITLENLAKLTKNFTGAEIEALVKSAASFSFNRYL
jgi:vesicle-fusing ATPase